MNKYVKKILSRPPLMIGILIAIVLVFIGITALINHFTPSKERADLIEHFNLPEDKAAIILNYSKQEETATIIDGKIYVDISFVKEYLNKQFYWDTNENILLCTTPTEIISAKAESTNFSVGKASTDFGSIIVKATSNSALVNLDFVTKYSNMLCTVYTEPNRVVIETKGIADYIEAKKDLCIRVDAHIKSPILADIPKGKAVHFVEAKEDWVCVSTEDGLIGYAKKNELLNVYNLNRDTLVKYSDDDFLHIKKEGQVNLLWHQISTVNSGKNSIANVLTKSKGVNVISPTWFKIADNEGNLKSIASSDYVKYCHDHGVEVWALVSNFEVKEVDTAYILTHTSTRQNLVNQLVAKAVEFNLDGINVDFESMDGSKIGESYIQFLRELSQKLHALGIKLSTDVPVPAEFNAHFQYGEQSKYVDYVVMMGYDQHWGQASGEGSVAALNWVEESLINIKEQGVPSDQLVLGMPFYTKLWILTPKEEANASEVTYVIGFQNIGMDQAQKWVDENVSQLTWLEDCGQSYGEATKNKVIYKIWLENATSLEKRLQLMKKYELAGAAFWKSGFENDAAWDVIIKYVN